MRWHWLLVALLLIVTFITRFYHLGVFPPGLTNDEISIGVNAYSLLRDGTDQHGVKYPLWFRAEGEYKLPGYVYATSFSMLLFGKDDFALRLPSAVAGGLGVLFFYLFTQELVRGKKKEAFVWLPLIASSVMAFSPWYLQASRMGYEASLGLMFFIVALYLWTLFLRKKSLLFLGMSVCFFIFAMYTYNSYRVLVPLMLLSLFYSERKLLFTFSRKVRVMLVGLFLLCITPVMMFSVTSQGLERFRVTSAFSELQNEPFITRITGYPVVFLHNFVQYFSPFFLSQFQEPNIIYYISKDFGVLFHWEILFLIIGVLSLLRLEWSNVKKMTLILLFLSPVPAALTVGPHPLRSLQMIVPLSLLIGLGILFMVQTKKRLMALSLLVPFILFELFLFLHTYLIHYPILYQGLWGKSKEVVMEAERYDTTHEIIINTKILPSNNLAIPFYNEQLRAEYVNDLWLGPQNPDKPVLYITHKKDQMRWAKEKKLLKTITLDTPNKDFIANFWEL